MNDAITLEALKALDAIDKQGSFAAAAASLYKVPSALSYTIKKLEQDIGVDLFDRSKQRATLTPAGKLALQHGRELLLASQRMLDSIQQLDSGWESELRIARDTVIPSAPLFQLLQKFSQLEQHVNITLGVEALGGGWDALHSRRADIVIGANGELPKGLFNMHKIGSLMFVFCVAPEHPLALVETPISAEQLAQYPAIVVTDTSQQLPVRDSGLFISKQVIRVNTMHAKIVAQQQGLGTGFLPKHLIKSHLDDGSLIEKNCHLPRPAQDIYIAWHKQQTGKAFDWFVQQLCKLDWKIECPLKP
ncbi:LysR family transcriptional regulator [Agarivorans sp. QJM3NY_33]|uniref:LysR family transcriptional regulator n=1 Tax=Agarivorans sp. QJM3NY_33 TaxID=3421432 RepID=UPI003D7EE9EB